MMATFRNFSLRIMLANQSLSCPLGGLRTLIPAEGQVNAICLAVVSVFSAEHAEREVATAHDSAGLLAEAVGSSEGGDTAVLHEMSEAGEVLTSSEGFDGRDQPAEQIRSRRRFQRTRAVVDEQNAPRRPHNPSHVVQHRGPCPRPELVEHHRYGHDVEGVIGEGHETAVPENEPRLRAESSPSDLQHGGRAVEAPDFAPACEVPLEQGPRAAADIQNRVAPTRRAGGECDILELDVQRLDEPVVPGGDGLVGVSLAARVLSRCQLTTTQGIKELLVPSGQHPPGQERARRSGCPRTPPIRRSS